MSSFGAWMVQRRADGVATEWTRVDEDRLPDGEVLVKVVCSSLNFKDGMILGGDRAGVVQTFPMVPGIDFAGVVVKSRVPEFAVGSEVIATGWGLGEKSWGGYAELARVPAAWLIAMPRGMSMQHAMVLGTAGLTAAMAVDALQQHGVAPESGPVLVTGGAGGVGMLSLLYLQCLGYRTVAAVRDGAQRDYVRSFGITESLGSSDILASPDSEPRWAGVIDCLGGEILARLVPQVGTYGCVACVGSGAGATLQLPLAPLVARGVSIVGTYSVMLPKAKRIPLWDRLSVTMDRAVLDAMTRRVAIRDLLAASADIIRGDVMGRVRVDVSP